MYDIKPKGKKSAEKRKRKNFGRIPMSTRPGRIIESKKRKHEKNQSDKELKAYLKNKT